MAPHLAVRCGRTGCSSATSRIPSHRTIGAICDRANAGPRWNLQRPIQNPFTGQIFPDGRILLRRSPLSKAVFDDLPAPNIAGLSNNLQTLPKQTTRTDKADVRLDQYLNSQLNLFGRFSYRSQSVESPSSIPGPSGGNSNGHVIVKSWQTAIGATHPISNRSVLEARLGFSHTDAGKTPWFVGTTSLASRFSLPNYPTDPRFTAALRPIDQRLHGARRSGKQSTSEPNGRESKLNYPAGWKARIRRWEFQRFTRKSTISIPSPQRFLFRPIQPGT